METAGTGRYCGKMAQADLTLYRKLREARRQRGVTQSHLAREVGCKQSAISMMERGNPSALAWESVERIAEFLDVDLGGHEPPSGRSHDVAHGTRRYCPVLDCPSNMPYVVQGELRFLPADDAASGPHCRYCGEVLESACPNPECAGPVVKGAACCPACGTCYVAVEEGAVAAPEAWADAQLARLSALGLSQPFPSPGPASRARP